MRSHAAHLAGHQNQINTVTGKVDSVITDVDAYKEFVAARFTYTHDTASGYITGLQGNVSKAEENFKLCDFKLRQLEAATSHATRPSRPYRILSGITLVNP